MKSLKTYLIVVSFLLLGAVALLIYVWYRVQETQIQLKTIDTTEATRPKGTTDSIEPQINNTDAPLDQGMPPTAQIPTPTPTVEPTPEVTKPIVVDTNTLSDSQQKILKTFGYDEGTLTITPAMISCAEEAVGKERLAEILDGGSPSTMESIKILPCFKA
jgi:cytoskeletal protein RodZ